MAVRSLRSILGGEDVRRTTRQASRSSLGEGLPGSGVLEGAVRTHQIRKRAQARADRIQARLPSYFSERPTYQLGAPMEGALGTLQYKKGPDQLSLDAMTVFDLAGEGGRKEQKQAQQVLLHELVHANQPEPKLVRGRSRSGQKTLRFVTGPEWATEGGAELLSRKLARGMFGLRDPLGAYQPYVRRVRRSGGAPWVIGTLMGPER